MTTIRWSHTTWKSYDIEILPLGNLIEADNFGDDYQGVAIMTSELTGVAPLLCRAHTAYKKPHAASVVACAVSLTPVVCNNALGKAPHWVQHHTGETRNATSTTRLTHVVTRRRGAALTALVDQHTVQCSSH